MQSEALKLWAELEQESDQKLLRQHGTLNYGEPDRGETVQARSVHAQCKTITQGSLSPWPWLKAYQTIDFSFLGAGQSVGVQAGCRAQGPVSQGSQHTSRVAS